MTCGRCGAEVIERFVGATRIRVHVNPRIDHPVVAPRKIAPLTESEHRLMDGNR
jgi:hypothetical protein